ncbi:hypothetical protein BpOF4_13055 [Alkalihalophilus pseudofirmus OF4]|uniref:histidine kinase n=1 Tax=Alkalihalophilus pseudofirmus (strain ATCC BAA-2126 / JCM 17055 / OF4) TaxID=398511 RepID=D3FXF1_ALKPO|nr:methyl-accepting chemotaxis protein [Alkalihalophilus pseudofirmus]ADC50662.1 hypothetical protein BpOF4_13055 [Alkalihalophilus pseudofirmus OF4]
MKRNTIMFQLLVKIGLFLGVLALIILLVGYYFIKIKVEEFQQEQVYTATSIVMHAMDGTQESANTIERMIEQGLYTSSKGIASDLRGRDADSITMDELRELAESWGVEEISLWERADDDIIITQSSDPTQLNMSSKNWGYWFTAFNQLMELEPVTIEEGHAMERFWAGPVSRAERFEHIYYKFAYYFDGTTDFMINAFISDEEIYRQTFQSGPTQMIDKIIEENIDIEEIAVINSGPWLNPAEVDIVEPQRDLPVLHGHHTIETEEDAAMITEVQELSEMRSVEFSDNQISYKKIYQPLDNGRVMTITMNLERLKEVRDQFLLLFVGTFLVASMILIIIIRLAAKRQLRPIDQIVEQIHKLAEGNLTHTLDVHEKNEFDWLADQLNEMTAHFNRLITELKDESHSLVVVSSLLSKQVYSSVKSMGDTSAAMTAESKDLLFDLTITLEQLAELISTIDSISQADSNNIHAKEFLVQVQSKVKELEAFSKDHSNQVTNLTFMFYDTLEELNEASKRIDALSVELNKKISFFKVDEERL